MGKLLRRLGYWLNYRRANAELAEEIESHRAMKQERLEQAGLNATDASDESKRMLGNPLLAREQARDVWSWIWLDDAWRDLRSSLRTFRRYPGVTCLALLSLTLGIGANTLAFTFVNVLLFPHLPYPSPDRLVIPDDPITARECLALRDRAARVFEDFGCFADGGPSSASIPTDNPGSVPPEHLLGRRFTTGVGAALAVEPEVGRWFSEAEETAAAGRVIVISHRLWQRRFGGSFDILNTRVRIDGESATVIGVLPDKFEFLGSDVDYWFPLRSQDLESHREERVLGAVARLRQDVSIEQAQSLMDTIVVRGTQAAPPANRYPRALLMPLDQYAQVQNAALVLQGSVAFVLLIACANVAGLLLTQAVSQQREFAVRAAIGSGTWRIVRQVLVHSVVLFLAGGLLGLAAGWAGVRLMVNVVLPYVSNVYGEARGGPIRGMSEAGIDGTVLLFTFTTAVVFGLVAAIAPALQVSRGQPLDALRESSQGITSGVARQRLRSVFVTAQIALAFVLLMGTALMLNGLTRTLNQDIGFDTGQLLAAHVQLPAGGDPNAMRATTEQMRKNLLGIAGVTSATAIAISPPLSGTVNFPIRLGNQVDRNDVTAQFLPILPDYFKTLQVAVVQGREFGLLESTENAPVAIVNEAAAHQFWPNETPLGKRIQVESERLPTEPPRRVIGVVREISQYTGQQSRPQLYVPYSQLTAIHDERLNSQVRAIIFIIRTERPAPDIAPTVGEAIGLADRNQAISSVRTMQHTAFASSYRRGVFVALIGLFGVIAVVLALTGVYGVMANVVNQRFGEFGIRMALGANPSQIRRLVVRHGGVLIGIGLFLGIAVSLAVTRVLRSFLFGTSPTDPLTFALGTVVLGGIALLACYIPAWRASRIDATTALRRY